MPKYVQLYGWSDVTGATVDLSVSSLPAFSTKVGTPSFVQSYTMNGVGLTDPVTITAPAGYQVSINNTTFAASVVVPPNASGVIAAQEVFVRMLSATAGTFGGSISHIGGGAADKYLAITGTATTPVGPPITSLLSGSSYTNAIFSNKITAGGILPVTSYGAGNLPAGLSVNTTNGVVSGTVAVAGSYTFNVSASTQDGTTTTNYTLRVVSAAEQSAVPLGVAINKYQNSTTDRVELLVIGNTNDAAPGPPVDMRGMILKDFGSNMAADTGGKYQFKSNSFWSSVKAGTLVVLSAGTSAAEDFDASDWVLRVNLGNTEYFTHLGGIFDIANTDMVMIKPAMTGVEGVAGAIHALAAGSSGVLYSGFSGKKMRSSNALTSGKTFTYVINDSSKISDFYLSQGADIATSLTFGSGNNSKNKNYITSLRNLDQTPPVVTLNGSATVDLVVGDTYKEQGATATGATTSVTTSGSVNTAAAGIYTLTYSAADAAGNVGTVTRTVIVAKATPGIVVIPTSSVIIAGQKLSASLLTGGAASVPGTFTWSTSNQKVSNAGTADYEVTFTPDDTANYNTVTAMVSVTAGQGTAFESWAAGHDLAGADAKSGADPDRDGMSNALEFDLGRNPARGDGWARGITATGGNLNVTYLQRIGSDLTVQASSDLSAGFGTTASSTLTIPQPADVPVGYEQYEVSLPTTGGRAFLRILSTSP